MNICCCYKNNSTNYLTKYIRWLHNLLFNDYATQNINIENNNTLLKCSYMSESGH